MSEVKDLRARVKKAESTLAAIKRSTYNVGDNYLRGVTIYLISRYQADYPEGLRDKLSDALDTLNALDAEATKVVLDEIAKLQFCTNNSEIGPEQ